MSLLQTTLTTQIKRIHSALRARQLPDGALLSDPMSSTSPNWLMPYYSNLAVIGWIAGILHTAERRDFDRTRRWLMWYTQHMNSDGTIYDYTYHNGVLTSNNTYDSSDSYAATFLEAMRDQVQATGDARLAEDLYVRGIQRAVNAIMLTYQSDGLTYARPDYPVKFLMDNVEVYRGLQAAAKLAQRVRRHSDADAWRQRAQRTYNAILNDLWLAQQGHYAWGKHPNGALETRLSEWYPDLMAQLMTIAWLPRTPRHETLYATLKARFYNLPPSLNDNAAVEQAVWWGMAAKTIGDTATLSDIRAKLLAIDLRRRNLYPLSLYGHMARVLLD